MTERFINRHAYGNTNGYNFRVLQKNGIVFSKLFSDSKYGSQKNALIAAQQYKREYILKFGIPINYHRKHKKNKMQLVGVTLIKYGNRVAWIASTIKDGKQTKKSFSVAKYGYEDAYKYARNYRIEYTKQKDSVPTCPPKQPQWLIDWQKTL